MTAGTALAVEFLPPLPEQQISARLLDLLGQAACARGLFAYWTLPSDWVPDTHLPALQAPGFLCLDIHAPTSIDDLADLKSRGVNVFLHLFDIAGQTEQAGMPALPPHLMHAKMLLLDMPDGTAVLWTGSHNATNRAMYGINVEASVLLTLDRSSQVYLDAEAFVEAVRGKCQAFDGTLVDYYKWLQGLDHGDFVIEMEDAEDRPITGTTITLFGVDEAELKQLKTVDKGVVVSLISASSRVERYYQARIDKTGRKRGIVDFEPCRYAFRDGTALPLLESHGAVPKRVTNRASYFVSLVLDTLLPETTRSLALPTVERWAPVPEGRLASRVPERERTGRRRDKDKEPVLRAAAPPAAFRCEEKTLATRRQEAATSKLVMRVVLTGHRLPSEPVEAKPGGMENEEHEKLRRD